MTDKKVKPKKDAAKSLQDLFEDCLKDALWAEISASLQSF